ncbi:MAG: hypothetical protein V4724_07370, partial [Pseudomonadota bacterium]
MFVSLLIKPIPPATTREDRRPCEWIVIIVILLLRLPLTGIKLLTFPGPIIESRPVIQTRPLPEHTMNSDDEVVAQAMGILLKRLRQPGASMSSP